MSAAVALPLGRGVDISGQRFGLLTALHVVRKSRGHNIWVFVCDCKQVVVRTAASAIGMENRGVLQMCIDCKDGRYGTPTVRAKRRTLARVAVFKATGHLYSPEAEQKLCAQIRRDIAERLWIREPVQPLPFELPIGGYSLADAEHWGTMRRWHGPGSGVAAGGAR